MEEDERMIAARRAVPSDTAEKERGKKEDTTAALSMSISACLELTERRVHQ